MFSSINCASLWFRRTAGKLDIRTGFASLTVRNPGLVAKFKTVRKKYEESNISDHGRHTVFMHLMVPFGLSYQYGWVLSDYVTVVQEHAQSNTY